MDLSIKREEFFKKIGSLYQMDLSKTNTNWIAYSAVDDIVWEEIAALVQSEVLDERKRIANKLTHGLPVGTLDAFSLIKWVKAIIEGLESK